VGSVTSIITLLLTLLIGGVLGVSLLLGFGGLIWYGHQRLQAQLAVLRTVTEGFGGHFEPRSFRRHASGRIPTDDGTTTVTFFQTRDESSIAFTDIEVPIPICVPSVHLTPETALSGVSKALGGQDIELGDPALDHAFVIRGISEEVRGLLSPEICSQIARLRDLHSSRHLELALEPVRGGSGMLLRVRKKEWLTDEDLLRTYISVATELASAVRERHLAPWRAASEALGLTLTEEPRKLTLSGSVHGVRVQATLELSAKQRWLTRIYAETRGPPGLRLVHVDHGEGASIRLADPVLGMMVHVSGEEPAAVSALLQSAELTETLLPIVHGYPGSTVTEDTVTLVSRERLWGRLTERVEQVARLAAQVSQRQAAGSAQALRARQASTGKVK